MPSAHAGDQWLTDDERAGIARAQEMRARSRSLRGEYQREPTPPAADLGAVPPRGPVNVAEVLVPVQVAARYDAVQHPAPGSEDVLEARPAAPDELRLPRARAREMAFVLVPV